MHCFTNLTLSLLLAPSGAIQNFAAQSITSRQASLVWEDVACLYRGGILVAYEVTIRDPNSAVTGQRRNVTQRTLTVTDLIPFTRYGFTVRYFNRIGPGPNSTEYLLTTLEDSKNQITCIQSELQSSFCQGSIDLRYLCIRYLFEYFVTIYNSQWRIQDTIRLQRKVKT